MATVGTLINNSVDNISNKNHLLVLSHLVESNSVENNAVNLVEEQVLMLKFSDKDIETGRIISQEQLDKNDLEWLREK